MTVAVLLAEIVSTVMSPTGRDGDQVNRDCFAVLKRIVVDHRNWDRNGSATGRDRNRQRNRGVVGPVGRLSSALAIVKVTTVSVLLALGANPTLLNMLTTNSPLLPGSAAVGSDATTLTSWSDRMLTVAAIGSAE